MKKINITHRGRESDEMEHEHNKREEEVETKAENECPVTAIETATNKSFIRNFKFGTHFNEATSLITHGGLGHYDSELKTTTTTSSSSSSPNSPISSTPSTKTTITMTSSIPEKESIPADIIEAVDLYASQFNAGEPRSLSGIALRSFILGFVFSLGLTLTLYLSYLGLSIWRVPLFISSLCLFHFLEFCTTAYANPAGASISSFLLTSNGAAYNIAHSCSLLETILNYLFFTRNFPPRLIQSMLLSFGFILVLIGQITRTWAILSAGPSFSHIIAHHKQKSHKLITHGIYSVLRHPSYFGFFWWCIGTQLVCGNIICLISYAFVLFMFFKARIQGEELLLVKFFGQDYVRYAQKTVIGIPGLH